MAKAYDTPFITNQEEMAEKIHVPPHLESCGRCRGFYKLLVRAYAADRGAAYDESLGQEHLCDKCGVTFCGTNGCECRDVLCVHGRRQLRAETNCTCAIEAQDPTCAVHHT